MGPSLACSPVSGESMGGAAPTSTAPRAPWPLPSSLHAPHCTCWPCPESQGLAPGAPGPLGTSIGPDPHLELI